MVRHKMESSVSCSELNTDLNDGTFVSLRYLCEKVTVLMMWWIIVAECSIELNVSTMSVLIFPDVIFADLKSIYMS